MTWDDALFHFSLPVSDLARSRAFYEGMLGGKVGRVQTHWLDVWIFGGQLTLQAGESLPAARGRFHSGATVDMMVWEQLRDRLLDRDAQFAGAPAFDPAAGVAKMYLMDPDDYAVEIKAYTDLKGTLQRPD